MKNDINLNHELLSMCDHRADNLRAMHPPPHPLPRIMPKVGCSAEGFSYDQGLNFIKGLLRLDY